MEKISEHKSHDAGVRKESRNRYLCVLIKNDDRVAREEIIKENENKIFAAANETMTAYGTDRMASCDIEHDDLAQEGRIALLNAAMNYDPDKDISFSTYSYTVIKNAMSDLVRKGLSLYENHMINDGAFRVFLDAETEDDDGVSEIEKQKFGGDDPTGDLAVFHVMVEKMGNRLCGLKPRKYRLIEFRYGLKSREYRSWAVTSEHFGLNEHYLMSIEKDALKELRNGMNDGKIV